MLNNINRKGVFVLAKKTFREKLMDSRDMPRVVELTDPKAIARYSGTRMLIAPPLAYDALMKMVPQGALTTSDALRAHLAKQHAADFTCPLTAGIFINIAAGAANESGGGTPYWRTLKKGGELNEKYPGGIGAHAMLLEGEGHTIIKKGKRNFVADFEKNLFDFDS